MFFAEYLIESALSLQQSNSFQVSFFIQRLYSQVNSDTKVVCRTLTQTAKS